VAQPGGRGPLARRGDLSSVETMAAAADAIRALQAVGSRILDGVIAGGGAVADWRHYPEGEVYDPGTHAQYFYHAHPPAERGGREHGHFHLFLRAEGMQSGARPLLLPELAVADAPARAPQAAPAKRGSRDEVSHLVAVAIDRSGDPYRLFTTNRWVTGETWYRAEDVIGMLDRFRIDAAPPPAAANRWLPALLRLFRPQIADLLEARDEAVMAWRRRRRTRVLEDPRLEIPSSLDIDLEARLAFVEAARRGPPGQARPGLPRMADGWADEG
jgi:uncharacterized protein DUF6969